MKTSREIALERRKAMSDSGKKAVAISSTTQDRVRSSDDIQISGTKSSINTNLSDISQLDKSGSPLLAKDAALLFCFEADLPCLDCASLLAKTISLLVLVIGFLF